MQCSRLYQHCLIRRATWKLLELKSQKSEISSSRLIRVCFCELKHSDLVPECGSVELLAIIDKTKAQRSNRESIMNEANKRNCCKLSYCRAQTVNAHCVKQLMAQAKKQTLKQLMEQAIKQLARWSIQHRIDTRKQVAECRDIKVSRSAQ
jgi:hypothetical protein